MPQDYNFGNKMKEDALAKSAVPAEDKSEMPAMEESESDGSEMQEHEAVSKLEEELGLSPEQASKAYKIVCDVMGMS